MVSKTRENASLPRTHYRGTTKPCIHHSGRFARVQSGMELGKKESEKKPRDVDGCLQTFGVGGDGRASERVDERNYTDYYAVYCVCMMYYAIYIYIFAHQQQSCMAWPGVAWAGLRAGQKRAPDPGECAPPSSIWHFRQSHAHTRIHAPTHTRTHSHARTRTIVLYVH